MKNLLFIGCLYCLTANAQVKSIAGPPGSGDFGYSVTVLTNGNYVITDPYFIDGGVQNVGAVYLYSGRTHTLISTLKGSNANDVIGLDGIVALSNGNFVVKSHFVDNGSVMNAGAITWVDGNNGLEGKVTIANSLIGASTNDSLGSGGVISLANGNYLIISPKWNNGPVVNAGAVTFANGANPLAGTITTSNSLVGSSVDDAVGADGVEFLQNGNLFVRSNSWDNGSIVNAGAATFFHASSGTTGVVGPINSLVGSTTDDFIDFVRLKIITELTNGNFVVVNPNWDNGNIPDAGAVTWGNGTTGIAGVIGIGNSLVGTTPYEQVGGGPGQYDGVIALSNGNYVVATPGWDNDFVANAGAVTWGNGSTGITGIITAANSLVGSSVEDEVGGSRSGWCGVVPLTNGNYVVGTAFWNNGIAEDVGAVTWGNGATGITGEVSPLNSLVGKTSFDFTEYGSGYRIKMITPLSNGNYVISTPNWDNGNIVDAGAITWANGNSNITGEVNNSNSLVGTTTNDALGYVTALPNGNYVVCAPYWDNAGIADAGAVMLANGAAAINGEVNSATSLVGSHANDNIGGTNNITVLPNSNFIISSEYWDSDTAVDVGAATWVNGMTGKSGPINSSNSLTGTFSNDKVSSFVTPLTNGNYVVASPGWNNGSSMLGAVTWGNGNVGITGPVTNSNSLVGSQMTDLVGWVFPLNNGNYIVLSQEWHNTGPTTGRGAVTFGDGRTGITGIVSSDNSIVGTSPGDYIGEGLVFTGDHYIIVSPHFDNGSINDGGAVTLGSTSNNITGIINSCNSILGQSTGNGWRLTYAASDVYGYLICGQALHNVVHILQPSAASIVTTTDSASITISGNEPVPVLSIDGCHLLATIEPGGANPVQGVVSTKVWKESGVPVHNGHSYVSRHYQVMPSSDPAAATARVTLYFMQQEFDDFNMHSGSLTDLPVNAADTSGIAKLRIIKYPGISNDNTGLPASYTGSPLLIDPSDQDIHWNEMLARWEVGFDVTGFSGFVVQTDIPILPLTLLEFKGRLLERDALLNWKTADEINTGSFDIERSLDGRSFKTVGQRSSNNQPGVHTYGFVDNDVRALGASVIYYRLKLLDIDGRFTYSNVITLTVDQEVTIKFHPNPARSNATLTIQTNEALRVQGKIIDNMGRIIRTVEWSIASGNNFITVPLEALTPGLYFVEITIRNAKSRIPFVKL